MQKRRRKKPLRELPLDDPAQDLLEADAADTEAQLFATSSAASGSDPRGGRVDDEGSGAPPGGFHGEPVTPVSPSALNPQPRINTILLPDCSNSMSLSLDRLVRSGARLPPEVLDHVESEDAKVPAIDLVNRAVLGFRDFALAHPLLRVTLEVLYLPFDSGVDASADFVPLPAWTPKPLTAGSGTNLCGALAAALDRLEAQRQRLDRAGVPRRADVLLLLTDGYAGDAERYPEVAARLAALENRRPADFYCYPVATLTGSRKELARLHTKRPPCLLAGLRYAELFRWLTSTLTALSASRLGDSIAAEDPRLGGDGPNPWAVL